MEKCHTKEQHYLTQILFDSEGDEKFSKMMPQIVFHGSDSYTIYCFECLCLQELLIKSSDCLAWIRVYSYILAKICILNVQDVWGLSKSNIFPKTIWDEEILRRSLQLVKFSSSQRGNCFQLGESSPTSAISCNRRQLAWDVHSQYSNTLILSNNYLQWLILLKLL